MQHQTYSVDAAKVISEIIEGEAIIMDLKSGAYYSADGVGAHVWRGVTLGASRDQLLDWAVASYPDQSGVRSAVDAFLENVVENALARPQPVETLPAVALDRLSGPYQAPRLSVHKDMEDLIMLDPIHDVSETTGWPIRKVD